MIVAVGDNEPPLRIPHKRVRGAELARASPHFSDGPYEFSILVEHRDASDEIRILDVRVTFCDVHIASRSGEHVGRIGQGLRRVSRHAGFPESHKHFSLRAELDDDASLIFFVWKHLELLRRGASCVGHPDISIGVDMNAVRPHEHIAAKTCEPVTGLIELLDRVHFSTDAARCCSTSIGDPHGLAVAVNGDAVRCAPRPACRQRSPISNRAIRVRAGVYGLNVVCRPIGLAESVSSVGDRVAAIGPDRSMNPISLVPCPVFEIRNHVWRGVVCRIAVDEREVSLPCVENAGRLRHS